jgi:hypothetical protein
MGPRDVIAVGVTGAEMLILAAAGLLRLTLKI